MKSAKFSGFFTPSPPSPKLTQPPLLNLLLGYPTQCRRHLYMAPKQTFLLAYAPLNFDLYGVVAAMRAGEKKRGSCRVFSSRHGLGRSRARSSIYASKWCNFEKLQRLEITIFGWQTSSAEGLQQQPEIKACSRWLAFSFGGGVDRPSIIYGQGFPTT